MTEVRMYLSGLQLIEMKKKMLEKMLNSENFFRDSARQR
jgi:hypothetical protein